MQHPVPPRGDDCRNNMQHPIFQNYQNHCHTLLRLHQEQKCYPNCLNFQQILLVLVFRMSGKKLAAGSSWSNLAMSNSGATTFRDIDTFLFEDLYLVDCHSLFAKLDR